MMASSEDAPDDIGHVVRLLGFIRTAESSSMSLRFGSSLLGTNGGSSILFDGIKRHQFANHQQRRSLIVVGLEMAYAGALRMVIGAAEFLHRNFFVRGRAYHVGAVMNI